MSQNIYYLSFYKEQCKEITMKKLWTVLKGISAIFHGSFVDFVQDVGIFEIVIVKVGSLNFFTDASPPSPLSEPNSAAQSAVPVAVEHEGAEPDSHPDPH